LHNFGAAVDLSIVDEKNNPRDMGCAFDTNDEIAYPSAEARLLSAGRLTQQQVDNRKLLRTVMYKAGFYNIQTEWWHFNSCTREAAWAKYKIIE
jgi:D-alanyl-D-alanine dipeptidase